MQPWWDHLRPAPCAQIQSRCAPTLRNTFFPHGIKICPLHLFLLVLMLLYYVLWDGLHTDPGRCTLRRRICRCVLTNPNRHRILSLAMYAVGKWVQWVHGEVERNSVYSEEDGKRRWCMCWQCGSFCTGAHSLCSSANLRLQKPSSDCQLSCALYVELEQWEYSPWLVLLQRICQ